jgi:Fur family transcriptional regulator, ferric uptake regulator
MKIYYHSAVKGASRERRRVWQQMERDTTQRRAIRAALEQAGRPLSPSEVLQLARREVGTLGLATVYRALNALVAEGWLAEVELPGDSSRYEVAGKEHHHHFVCEQCGGVYDINACPGGMWRLVPDGFELARHDVVLYGACARCAAG